jgi:hypothetical protein
VLRSGAYSDDVITNLVRRRFVAHMYDVAPPGANYGDGSAHDPQAVTAIGDLDAIRGRRGRGGSQDTNGRVRADDYPTALFLAPDGSRLGNGLWGIMAPQRLLAELRAVMSKWPGYFVPTAAELAVFAAAAAEPAKRRGPLVGGALALGTRRVRRCHRPCRGRSAGGDR